MQWHSVAYKLWNVCRNVWIRKKKTIVKHHLNVWIKGSPMGWDRIRFLSNELFVFYIRALAFIRWNGMFIISFSDEFGTSFGTIFVITILSILLTIAVAVIIFLKIRRLNSPRDKKKENDQKQEEPIYENGPQLYTDLTVVDENEHYVELDTKKDMSLYQNMSLFHGTK